MEHLLIFISAIAIFSFLISAFTAGSFGFLGIGDGAFDFPFESINTYLPSWLIIILGFFAFAIPFALLFMLGLKILSNNTKSFGKVASLTLLALWILSVLGLTFSGIDFVSKYKYQGIDTTTQDIELVANDTLSISMVGNDEYHDTKYLKHNNGYRTVNDNGIKKTYSTDVDFDIRKSDSDFAYIKIRKEARGRSYDAANSNAEKLEYQFNLSDSNLKLNGYFLNELENSFFDQEVDVILYLPKGATIYLDKSTKTFIDDISNVQNIYDRRMIKHYYIMGDSELDCIDCEEWNSNTEKEDDNLNLKIDDEGVNLKNKI